MSSPQELTRVCVAIYNWPLIGLDGADMSFEEGASAEEG